jgi:hypothetical protein
LHTASLGRVTLEPLDVFGLRPSVAPVTSIPREVRLHRVASVEVAATLGTPVPSGNQTDRSAPVENAVTATGARNGAFEVFNRGATDLQNDYDEG